MNMCQWGVGLGFGGGRIPCGGGGGGGRSRCIGSAPVSSMPCRLIVVILYAVAILTPEVSSLTPTSSTSLSGSSGGGGGKKSGGSGNSASAPATVSWGSGVRITSLRVPHVVRNGSENGATLDCEFWVSRGAEAGLVVKWFLNNGPAPVYQWIYVNGLEGGKTGAVGNGGGPQGLGPLKGKLDLGFVHHHSAPAGGAGTPVVTPSGEPRVENAVEGWGESEARQHLSALRIRKPTIDLSGDYKCSVSTFHDEDSMVKRMLVFAPEKSMELWQSRAIISTGNGVGDDSVTSYLNVTCYARGIYPKPMMALLREPPTLLEAEGSGDMEGSASGAGGMIAGTTEIEAVGGTASVETVFRPEAGVFDIRASESLPERTLASPTVFHCELRIPEADYSVRRSIVYYPGSPDLSNDGAIIRPGSCSSWMHLILVLLCFCLSFVHASAAVPLPNLL